MVRPSARRTRGRAPRSAPEIDIATAHSRAREAWLAMVRCRAPRLLQRGPASPASPRHSPPWPASRAEFDEGIERHAAPQPASQERPCDSTREPRRSGRQSPASRSSSANTAAVLIPSGIRTYPGAKPAPRAGGGIESTGTPRGPAPVADLESSAGTAAESTDATSGSSGSCPTLSAVTGRGEAVGRHTFGRPPFGRPPSMDNASGESLPIAIPPRQAETAAVFPPEPAVMGDPWLPPDAAASEPQWCVPHGQPAPVRWPWQEPPCHLSPGPESLPPPAVARLSDTPVIPPHGPDQQPARSGPQPLGRLRDPWPCLLPDPVAEVSAPAPANWTDADRRQRLLNEQRGL